MMNVMTYKGYTARIDFDPRDGIFVGRVLGITDGISFHGHTVKELTGDFHAAIGHYLTDCKTEGRKPEKPYSGNLMLRLPPEIHAKVAIRAAANSKSINAYVSELLSTVE